MKRCQVFGCQEPPVFKSKAGFCYCQYHGGLVNALLVRSDTETRRDRTLRRIDPFSLRSTKGGS